MSDSIKTDDVIFNFFKQICDEKDDQKCVELGIEWINAMETNLSNMEANLNGYPVNFNGSNLASGVYLVRAETAGSVSTQKLMLLK